MCSTAKIKHVFLDKPNVGNLSEESLKVLAKTGKKMLIFWCINAIKHVFLDKPYVGNLFKGLGNLKLKESNKKRERK